MKKKFVLSLILVSCGINNGFSQKFENLALTPPMGWNSNNTFDQNINEQLIKETADAFVALGLKDAGYEYVCIDDGWSTRDRDKQGNLVADPVKFPHGMKALADYVHSKGLKLGIYNCGGTHTCAGYAGSRGHEYQDALKYAEWGIDYLKYDWCNTDNLNVTEAYITMRDALYAAGRPMIFSICEWGKTQPWKWGAAVGHLWRTTGDIGPHFDDFERRPNKWNPMSVLEILDKHSQDELRRAAGPGHWNDMDMMEVGNGMSFYEDQTHFALWAILCSPLILGNDIRKMDKQTLDLITNKELIAINQDALSIQGFRVPWRSCPVDAWAKPLKNGDWALVMFNRTKEPIDCTMNWERELIHDKFTNKELWFSKDKVYKIKDLYLHKEVGTTAKAFSVKLEKHQSIALRLSPSGKK
ncbi:alpha-galactosidase [Candidatus Symbiothrix dinenymphae]|nr:alpha-galactosidase [Candidatus Symbiothrix dinenymphae]